MRTDLFYIFLPVFFLTVISANGQEITTQNTENSSLEHLPLVLNDSAGQTTIVSETDSLVLTYKGNTDVVVFKTGDYYVTALNKKITTRIQPSNPELFWQSESIQISVLVVLILFGSAFWLYRLRTDKKKARLIRELLTQQELALSRTLNPHFIFNSLNSIHHYILKNDVASSVAFTDRVSEIISKITRTHNNLFTTLKQETELLKQYIQLENQRFKDRFDFEILLDPEIDSERILIPPMFIQPCIENAIWHGILPLQTRGLLTLEIKKYDGGILCVIEDNGIGLGSRKQEPKGAEITSRRIELLNSLYNTDFGITAITLTDETGKETGSKVVIKFPAIEA